MKSGLSPAKHGFGTLIISEEAHASLLRQLIAAGANSID